MPNARDALRKAMDNQKIISTHCHHLEGDFFKDVGLRKLVGNTYVAWMAPLEQTLHDGPPEAGWFDKVRFNSYFTALERGLQSLYGILQPLCRESWPVYAKAVSNAHKDPEWHLKALHDKCRYEHMLWDSYWEPGRAHEDPMFLSIFRINMFLYFHDTLTEDHNGNNALRYLGRDEPFPRLSEYLSAVDGAISERKKAGSAALKNALAYDRGLLFRDEGEDVANRLYDRLICGKGGPEDLFRLQNHVFFRICEMAAAHDLPLQCHTGLGKLVDTRAMSLREAIAANPRTRFVLFHASYPYMEDIMALCHNFPNVYPDICWLPIISPSAAERFVSEIIEVGLSNSLCWGCDTWTSEESLGALLFAKDVLAAAAGQKVERGYFSMENALDFLRGVLYDNARSLYMGGEDKSSTV